MVARRLRAVGFGAVLVLPNSPRSALEGWLARIPRRIGYNRPWCSWLLTEPIAARPGKVHMPRRSVVEVRRLTSLVGTARSAATATTSSGSVHQIHDYLHLAAVLGAKAEPLAPKLEIPDAEVQQAGQIFLSEWRAKHGEGAAGGSLTLLGLNPGAEYGPAKRWSAESFAAVAREVSRQVGNCLWLAFGSARDRILCEKLASLAGNNVLNLAGRTSLRQLMALLKLCRVVLTNDTGPMHVAAALGTPVIVPFGSTSPELTGPGLPGDSRHRLLKSAAPCSPCFRRVCPIDFRCMASISPDRVAIAVLDVIVPRR
jgi:heptosyltransferase II